MKVFSKWALILVFGLLLPAPAFADAVRDAFSAYMEKDYDTAAKLLLEAANEGDVKAQINLGSLYEEGHGVPKNMGEAAKWYKKASAQGKYRYSKNAQFLLGQLYDKGHLPLLSDAALWYKKAADGGHRKAPYYLGLLYANGRGVEKNNKTAVEWFRVAANQDYEYAQYELAQMYLSGRGVKKSLIKAHLWLSEAKDNYYSKAIKALPELEAKMTSAQIEASRKLFVSRRNK